MQYLVVPEDHPMATRDINDLSIADFKEDTFLSSTYQDLAIRAFSNVCEELGFSPKYTVVAEGSMIIHLVEMRQGITL